MKSLNLSGKINPILVEILDLIHSKAQELGIQFMVVGATARDLLFKFYDIDPYRMTMDIDVGVRLGVNGWDHFERLKNKLIALEKFRSTREIHKILYQNQEIPREVDILPFGEISDSNNEIHWPHPEDGILLNVSGFEEAFLHCETVKLRESPDLEIRVASLPSQFVLKLLAWKERGAGSDKDAKDIYFLIKNYGDPINRERLFGEEKDILQTEDFDLELAGAYLLGRDVSRVVTIRLRDILKGVLELESSESGNNRLAQSMMPQAAFSEDFKKNIRYLQKILAGLVA
ncbi:MAG: nucleotidyl transferase AbiEii/AbiGii toxin family protein [Desulfobulbaceae bacterium]|nr:nucleotidyl transferase AbiEii/AbiGii toxin family protein [Desulfobulbaceae bacterium]